MVHEIEWTPDRRTSGWGRRRACRARAARVVKCFALIDALD